ncbi:MAG: M20/M25/M40 family metallo-hydrolase [Candidatus Cloacimonadaceae bacterium]|nr:M20/M25/M40 family metallo-hydrolase [Candidatus Cloacimonadota bacterium]MCK9179061.1 M20/M25/M40 family metallo-hydrolase [Candidatus Cloacimonadota bacterium]MDD3532596.1 M20/M25/M40 family metallo-hydrolase [Candidatus Cloacimonadota bacterium]MDY0128054.1 M20/M25/M40 family metallo-hydrolase [Candidatus Cloacimonadaceae bacterium]
MKKTLILLSLLACYTFIFSVSLPFAMKDAPAAAARHAEVLRLAKDGAQIYHYNEDYILARIDPAKHTGFTLIGQPQGQEKLYLIADFAPAELPVLASEGRCLQIMGSDLLYASKLDEVALKAICRSSFVILRRPLSPFSRGFMPDAITQTRQDIGQLVNQVSADSVLFFIQSLQDMGTRYALADNRLTVATWIKDTFGRFGIDNARLEEFYWDAGTQYNVLAEIPGTHYPDQYVVIGGHYDSITYNTPYVFAPGADDNASGSAAALEIARVLKAANYQPKCSIRFITFAAEEFGLHGSHHNAQVSLDEGLSIRLMINHDMIANKNPGTTTVRLMPYDGCWQESSFAANMTAQYSDLEAIYGSVNSRSSDSYAYWSRQFPVIYFFETDFSPFYHSDDDLVINIDPDYCAQVIRASLATAVSFANMPAAPENLEVHDLGNGSALQLSWDDQADPDINHYLVYYGEDSVTENQPMQVYANQYILQNLNQGTLYQLAVSSVDSEGNESYMAFATGTPELFPRMPQGFSVIPEPDHIALSWQANTELDLQGYILTRSNDPDDAGSQIHNGILTETQYQDCGVEGEIGSYYYYRVQAVDTGDNYSDITPAIRSRPVSLNCGILIVDESADFAGSNPFQPSDEAVDSFFAEIMTNFNSHELDLADFGEDLSLADIGIYSSILWHGMDSVEVTAPFAMRQQFQRYLELGGKLFFTGYLPSKAWGLNAGYPADFANDDFLYEVLGIGAAEYGTATRFRIANPLFDPYPSLEVDEEKTLAAFAGHIIKVESISASEHGTNLYVFDSDFDSDTPQGALNGLPVGVLAEYGAGKSFVTSVPLYFIDFDQAAALTHHIFHNVFTEPLTNDDPQDSAPGLLSISPAYPNPFRQSTQIQVKGTDPTAQLTVKVYNLKGQLVRKLHQGKAMSAYSWDGLNGKGQPASSGIYFIRAEQGGKMVSRKVIRFR